MLKKLWYITFISSLCHFYGYQVGEEYDDLWVLSEPPSLERPGEREGTQDGSTTSTLAPDGATSPDTAAATEPDTVTEPDDGAISPPDGSTEPAAGVTQQPTEPSSGRLTTPANTPKVVPLNETAEYKQLKQLLDHVKKQLPDRMPMHGYPYWKLGVGGDIFFSTAIPPVDKYPRFCGYGCLQLLRRQGKVCGARLDRQTWGLMFYTFKNLCDLLRANCGGGIYENPVINETTARSPVGDLDADSLPNWFPAHFGECHMNETAKYVVGEDAQFKFFPGSRESIAKSASHILDLYRQNTEAPRPTMEPNAND